MAGYFITGTDTDVGKTVVTSLLLSYFHQKGIDVYPYKPIQSGAIYENGNLQGPDLQMYERVLTSLDTNKACTYLLKKASSPHLAAKEENVWFDIPAIQKNVERLLALHDLVLVEGAGGLIVPIQEDYCMIDLMKEIDLPVILVGRAGLGTINHTVLSVMALKQANITIEGIILNRLHMEDESIEKDNAVMIERLTGVKVLGTIPHLSDVEDAFKTPQAYESIFNRLNAAKEDIKQ
ncbi:dethiobiotin synthase [Falsibacillus albus]|uniref:ATP-dependent dethiobiotin synthetase BioD n=1 Tax=Falsibacillus albus TaxID=2478915 RepID=A0A3L7K594_9BACI|nr:dethiobiotin synthase [Falsibacillus albus]RLQ97434.1 dethiobiotin synthase [Falsibacillus albus]